jgi:hypothetical protein
MVCFSSPCLPPKAETWVSAMLGARPDTVPVLGSSCAWTGWVCLMSLCLFPGVLVGSGLGGSSCQPLLQHSMW